MEKLQVKEITGPAWASSLLEKIEPKLEATVERNFGKIPYVSTNGVYDDKNQNDISWWTNGFYAGELWQLYHLTGKKIYLKGARNVELLLDRAFSEFEGLHHDVGFMWLHTGVADYRITANRDSYIRGLHAATILAGRYNPVGKFIRAWNRDLSGWVIIDSLMNIPILYWASAETGDPRFKQIAMNHADTLLKYLIRSDGSAAHIGSFNAENGDFIETIGGQGFDADSAWSRGQAWAIYGYALSYHHTKEKRYLDAAKRIANFFIANVSQCDYLTLVDFKAPYSELKYDASAGVCAACGMLEIAKWVTPNEKGLYSDAATKILQKTAEVWGDWNPETDGIITATSHSYHQEEETHVPIVYGDYYFVEGLLRLTGNELFLW
ncbi:glycosyl hydrolase family 88 [Enterococcus asini]|uniref:glycosyl hydrolase family 88 n=1 Tax=Enterococcus asini TaxID=57732 RepID=UPI0032E45CF4